MSVVPETYTCTFVGRRKGASGIMYPITETVECMFFDIVPKLYDKYEHISELKIFNADNQPMNTDLAIEIADWN